MFGRLGENAQLIAGGVVGTLLAHAVYVGSQNMFTTKYAGSIAEGVIGLALLLFTKGPLLTTAGAVMVGQGILDGAYEAQLLKVEL
ncbi:MAG: hypothetical protein ACPL1K_01375 [Candidatus Kryptoniota bacterium]